MLDQTTIDQYLKDIDSYLQVDATYRKRVLSEIEGHLRDAVEVHLNDGVEPHEAMRRAIAELGPPSDVAVQFAPAPVPVRSMRGWRRWTPIVLPAAVLVVALMVSLSRLLWLRHGPTYGQRVVLWHSLRYTAVVGALTATTYVAIRNGDRDPAWRRAAWVLTAVTAVTMAVRAAL